MAILLSGYMLSGSQKLINGSSESAKYAIDNPSVELPLTSVEVIVDNNIPLVQGLIDSDSYNSLGASIVAMGACIVQIIIPALNITLARNTSSTAVSLTRIKSTLCEFINTWDQEYPLSIGDLQVRLGLVYSGTVTSFNFSGGVTYIAYLPDGRNLPFSSSEELGIEDDLKQLDPGSVNFTSELAPLQVSNRVLNYMASPEDIVIEVSNVQ